MKGVRKMECDRTNRNVGGEEGWGRVEEKLPKGYSVEEAMRRNKKGRACVRMLFGVRRGIKMRESRRDGGEKEVMMIGRIRIGEEIWRLGLVYMLGNRDRKWKELKKLDGGERGG